MHLYVFIDDGRLSLPSALALPLKTRSLFSTRVFSTRVCQVALSLALPLKMRSLFLYTCVPGRSFSTFRGMRVYAVISTCVYLCVCISMCLYSYRLAPLSLPSVCKPQLPLSTFIYIHIYICIYLWKYTCIYVFSNMLAAFHRSVSIKIRLLSFHICTYLSI